MENDPATYLGGRSTPAYLDRLLAQQSLNAVTARDQVTVAGGLVAYVLEIFEQVRKESYIYDLAVLASHRGQGNATALIGTLQQVAGPLSYSFKRT